MWFYFFYIAFSLILLLVSIILISPLDQMFSKMHNKLGKKFKKYKDKTVSISIILVLWWAFIIFTCIEIYYLHDLQRLVLSSIFIIFILLLNRIQTALYLLIITPTLLLIGLFKYKKKEKKFTDKLIATSRFKNSTLIFYLIMLFSFSFEYIITRSNYVFVGIMILTCALLYLLKSLFDIFKSQKDILFISDKLESFQDIIERKSFITHTMGLVTSIGQFYHKFYSKTKYEDELVIDKVIGWTKDKLLKLHYISKVGFSVFKTYLTIKLTFIVLSTLLFFILVNAQYFKQLQYLGIISTSFISTSQFLLLSFYSFIGQPIDNLIFISTIDYLSLYFLVTGIIGWIITVIYILLFFDILTTSLSDFYDTSNKAIKNLVDEFLVYLEKMMKDRKIEKNDEVVGNIKKISENDNNIAVDKVIDEIDKIQ